MIFEKKTKTHQTKGWAGIPNLVHVGFRRVRMMWLLMIVDKGVQSLIFTCFLSFERRAVSHSKCKLFWNKCGRQDFDFSRCVCVSFVEHQKDAQKSLFRLKAAVSHSFYLCWVFLKTILNICGVERNSLKFVISSFSHNLFQMSIQQVSNDILNLCSQCKFQRLIGE